MGLIRKSLYLGSGGLVSPSSKKQRRAIQMLRATQGATPAKVKRAGGRYDFAGFVGGYSAPATQPPTESGPPPELPPEIPQPPSARGWKLASILPSNAELGRPSPDECPRCHRTGGFNVPTPGKPHFAMGRKWCPGRPDIQYVYRDGYLHPVMPEPEQPTARAEEHPEPLAAPAAANRLAEVTRLHDEGLLTDEEYQAKRTEIIGQL